MNDNIKEIHDTLRIGESKFAEPLKAEALVKNISLKPSPFSLKNDSANNTDGSGVETERKSDPDLFERKPEQKSRSTLKTEAAEMETTPSSLRPDKKQAEPGLPRNVNKEPESRPARIAEITRKTKETDISCTLCLDGKGESNIKTGIGFFDHMLDGFARHGLYDLTLSCDGDLYVDCHHTIEDCGIVLGQALKEAIGDKKGMIRYGSFILPMDEALVLCAVDFSGRPYLGFDYEFKTDRVGYFDTEMVREFFYAVSYSAMMNLHFDIMRGTNAHHIIEAMFKAFAKAVDIATTFDPRITDILSTKGML